MPTMSKQTHTMYYVSGRTIDAETVYPDGGRSTSSILDIIPHAANDQLSVMEIDRAHAVVRCLNSHADLLEALKAIDYHLAKPQDQCEPPIEKYRPSAEEIHACRKIIEQAIAKATYGLPSSEASKAEGK